MKPILPKPVRDGVGDGEGDANGMASPPLRILILSDNKAGTLNQARGLAEGIQDRIGPQVCSVETMLARPRWPWSWLPARLWLGARWAALFRRPFPDLVIAAGRSAVAPAAALRRMSRATGDGATRVVALQDPRLPPSAFDLVILPAHDGITAPGVLVTTGALHRVTPARLAAAADEWRDRFTPLPRPWLGVLIGGASARYRFSVGEAAALGRNLAALARATGGPTPAAAARRTPMDSLAALRAGLAVEAGGHQKGLASRTILWDARDPAPPSGFADNPYFGILALADALLVTEDSVSMVSEAASTRRPVFLLPLQGKAGKFARFHHMLVAGGHARRLPGGHGIDGAGDPASWLNWQAVPLTDMDRAVTAVLSLLRQPTEKPLHTPAIGLSPTDHGH